MVYIQKLKSRLIALLGVKGAWPDNFGENDTYIIYCFIECGYHTLLIIWYYFFVNTQFWNVKFQDVNEKNYEQIYWYQNLKS